MYICVHVYIHIHVQIYIHVECRCRPSGKKIISIIFVCVSSALEDFLCKGNAFGMHPSKHILWHEKYTIISSIYREF